MRPPNAETDPTELLRAARGGEELTPRQAQAVSSFLLRRHGNNPEYPCTRRDRLPPNHQPTSPEKLEDERLGEEFVPCFALPTTDIRLPTSDYGNGKGCGRGQSPQVTVPHSVPHLRWAAALAALLDRWGPGQSSRPGGMTVPPSERKPPAFLLPHIARLLADSDLTRHQLHVTRRILLRGLSPQEVAWELSVTKRAVQRTWERSRGALRAALQESVRRRLEARGSRLETATTKVSARISNTDLAAVYAQEVNRRAYHPPRHCPQGRERCRLTGVCPFAINWGALWNQSNDSSE